jgi:hypothetical protein
MTSVLNSFIGLNTNQETVGDWEDVKVYSMVFINISVPANNGTFKTDIHLEWALQEDTNRRVLDRDTKSLTVVAGKSQLVQFPVKSDLFRLRIGYTPPESTIPSPTRVATLFKNAASQVILHSESEMDAAMVIIPTDRTKATCLKTRITDGSGDYISTTNDTIISEANALYVHPDISLNKDTEGNHTLRVSIPVESTTGSFNGKHSMLTSLSSAAGQAPAATASGGFFYALADACGYMISTTKTGHLRGLNGLNCTLSNVTTINPLWSEFVNGTPTSNREFTVMLPGAAPNYFVTTGDFSANHIVLRTLGLSNLTSTVKWVKVYDSSTTPGFIIDLNSKVKFNLPVPAYESRDINMGKGVNFANGIYFRVTSTFREGPATVSEGEPPSEDLVTDADTLCITGSYRVLNA